jgi:carbon-monoxide dehydrogenase large subunit
MARKYFGTPVKRVEDKRLVTGQGRYVDDIDLPGMLHAAFVRSEHAHAKIKSLDKSAAEALDGVHGVFTNKDLGPGLAGKRMAAEAPPGMLKLALNQHPLADGEVAMVGQTIALVVADTRHIAEDAARLVEIDYEPLPAMVDFKRALDKDAPKAHSTADDNLVGEIASSFGDVDKIFDGADHVIALELDSHRGGCHAMECRGVVASYDRLDGYIVHTASQAPFMVRRALAHYLEEDENLIRVAAPDVGGGFGPKGNIYAEEMVLPVAARSLGRPVKWIEDRREHFMGTSCQGSQYWKIEVAATKDGKILGLRGDILVDLGAFLVNGFVLPLTTLFLPLSGPYTIECLDFKLKGVYTNKTPTSPVRGAGRPNANFAFERAADAVARQLTLPPDEIRRRNLIPADRFPYETGAKHPPFGKPVIYDSGDLVGLLDKAIELSDYNNFAKRRDAARKQGRYLGIGVSSCVEDTGFGPYEGVRVKVQPSGKVLLAMGASSQGQGHETVFAQIVADQLGVAMEDIVFRAADSATTPLGVATVASRVTVTAAPATLSAAREVREKALAMAAMQLDMPAEKLEIEDGVVKPKDDPGANVSVSLAQLASALEPLMGGGLPPGVDPGLEATSYDKSSSMPYGSSANIAEVEVDIETGNVTLINYSVAHDCGTMINPMLVDGQIIGGVVHGIGNALFEQIIHDDAGQPLATNYGEYLLPMAGEMPPISVVHQETPSPNNELGVKGAGEGGTIPAASAVIAAIENALEEFGVVINEHPISPERICQLLDTARA